MTTQHSGYDLDNSGVITHLEPENLECEVKWLLRNITTNKASGGNGITVELFQILKKKKKKRCYEIAAFNMPANLENLSVVTELEKVSFNSNLK